MKYHSILYNSLILTILGLIFESIAIFAQCPDVHQICTDGWSYSSNPDHTPGPNGNWDEFGVIDIAPFLVKVGYYPPIRSFPRVYYGCNPDLIYYMSFDYNDNSPIPYNVTPNDWHEINIFHLDATGYSTWVLPPSAEDVGSPPDWVMNYNTSEYDLSWDPIEYPEWEWNDFVTNSTPTLFDFHGTLEGPLESIIGDQATYYANIYGGGGDYKFTWEFSGDQGATWNFIKKDDHAADWIYFDGNTNDPYYFYENEYKYTLTMPINQIELRCIVFDYYTQGTIELSKTISPALEISFINEIENNTEYGELILDEDKLNPIPSSTTKLIPYSSEFHTIRTDELPFIYNYNNTNQAEKHQFWDFTPPQFLLNHQFQVDQDIPIEMRSKFNETSPANIKNLLEGVAISGGQVQLNDPWFYYKDQNDNWFQSDIFKSYNSPFYIFNTTINTYGGVFLDQFIEEGNPYYSVKVDLEQTIPINGVNHKFYFMNWTGTDVQFEDANSNETGVVFDNANASAQAVLKGTQLSDYIYTYSQNGQRKFIRTPDGYLHTFYASMDGVWYERSTNTGQSWDLIHSEYPPLDNVVFKNPSMSFYNAPVVHEVLAYAVDYIDPLEPNKNDVVCIRNFVDGVTSQYAAEISTTDPLNSTYVYSNPAVACAPNGNTLVVWQTIKDGVRKKLQYAYGY